MRDVILIAVLVTNACAGTDSRNGPKGYFGENDGERQAVTIAPVAP